MLKELDTNGFTFTFKVSCITPRYLLYFIPVVITLGKHDQKSYSMLALNTPSLMGARFYVRSYVIKHMHVSDQKVESTCCCVHGKILIRLLTFL